MKRRYDTISPIEDEIDEIRLNIYNETKDMTPEQISEYYRKHGEIIAEEYGLRRITNANEV